jgi:hypothetical protein
VRAKYIISCDTGKREYVGAFKTGFFAMRAWRKYIAAATQNLAPTQSEEKE